MACSSQDCIFQLILVKYSTQQTSVMIRSTTLLQPTTRSFCFRSNQIYKKKIKMENLNFSQFELVMLYCCWLVIFSQSGCADGTQTHTAATIIPPENKCRAWFPCCNTHRQRKGSRLFALRLEGMSTFRFVKFTCFDFPTAGLHPSIPPPKKEIFCPRPAAPQAV